MENIMDKKECNSKNALIKMVWQSIIDKSEVCFRSYTKDEIKDIKDKSKYYMSKLEFFYGSINEYIIYLSDFNMFYSNKMKSQLKDGFTDVKTLNDFNIHTAAFHCFVEELNELGLIKDSKYKIVMNDNKEKVLKIYGLSLNSVDGQNFLKKGRIKGSNLSFDEAMDLYNELTDAGAKVSIIDM